MAHLQTFVQCLQNNCCESCFNFFALLDGRLNPQLSQCGPNLFTACKEEINPYNIALQIHESRNLLHHNPYEKPKQQQSRIFRMWSYYVLSTKSASGKFIIKETAGI